MTAQETITVAAVYENGQFRPLEPTTLPEHTRVQLTVAMTDERISVEDQFKAEDERIRAIFAAAGVPLAPRPAHSEPLKTEEEREALMRRIGPGVNASQAIIEERDTQL